MNVRSLYLIGGRSRRWIGNVAEHEAAFCSCRNDDDILGHLGLHQTQYFRSIVLPTVRPTDTPSSYETASEVDSGDIRSEYEDLVQGLRFGCSRHATRAQLERQNTVLQVGARSHRRIDQSEEASQNPVLIEGCDRIEASQQR